MRKWFLPFVFFASFLLFNSILVYAQNRPHLAVPSIKGTNVSQVEASTCRGMVETALIKTESFDVIAFTDMEAILEAQEFSISDCTDEECAVELGKLLTAEQIVVGELTDIGEIYVLILKLIDVQTGLSLRAEVVNIETLGGLHDGAFTAAYSLAGLKYIPGTEVGAKERGEIFVTAPEGMQLNVYLDSFFQGRTPILLEKIPFGSHILEARSYGYLYRKNVTIQSASILEIVADIRELKGNLLLSILPSEAAGYRIYVDHEEKDAGLIRDLVAGERKLKIEGNGWIYEGRAQIAQDVTLRETVSLLEVGGLKVVVPNGGKAMAIGEFGDYEFDAESFLSVPAGTYEVTVTHPDYEKYTTEVSVNRLDRKIITPMLVPNEVFRKRMALQDLKQSRSRLESTQQQMMKSFYTTVGVGIAAALAVGIMEGLIANEKSEIDDKYQAYKNTSDGSIAADLWTEIEDSKKLIESFRIAEAISVIGTGISSVLSAMLLVTKPSTDEVDESIAELERSLP